MKEIKGDFPNGKISLYNIYYYKIHFRFKYMTNWIAEKLLLRRMYYFPSTKTLF